ncbi:MAG: hypothetical protein V2B18_21280 [Pseudomonadota bacterium]
MRLKNKPFQVWIDMPDGSRFQVRDLPASKQKEFIAKNQSNPVGMIMDCYGYQFTDWQGVKDEEGQDYPFSRDALKAAIENDLDGLNEVMREFSTKLAEHKERLKSAEKN